MEVHDPPNHARYVKQFPPQLPDRLNFSRLYLSRGSGLLCTGREPGTAEFVVRFRTTESAFGHSRGRNLQSKKISLMQKQ